jgi:hypothetical protein
LTPYLFYNETVEQDGRRSISRAATTSKKKRHTEDKIFAEKTTLFYLNFVVEQGGAKHFSVPKKQNNFH